MWYRFFLKELLRVSGRYALNVLLAIDQLINAIFFGDADESISSRLGKHYPDTIAYKFVNLLFFWQDNHCLDAIEEDEGSDALIK